VNARFGLEVENGLAMNLEHHRENRRIRTKSRLVDLLISFQNCKCTEPRDKIYALLSLATDCQNGELKADYSKSLSAIYADVMQLYYPLKAGSWTVYYGHDLLFLSQLLLRMLRIPVALNTNVEVPNINEQATFHPIRCLFAGYIIELGDPLCQADSSKVDVEDDWGIGK
jgi:hypothetical protein